MNHLYRSMKQKWTVVASCLTVVGLIATGCGEPDIESMRPTQPKLAAEVLLVDGTQNWNTSDLISAASKTGVDVFVARVKSQDVASTLDGIVKNGNIGLCIVVNNGAISLNVTAYASQNPNIKFEFVSDGTSLTKGANVKNVYVNPTFVGFLIGYSTGELAGQTGRYTIGWLTSGATSVSKQEISAALGGVYQADPKVNVVPVTVGPTNTLLPRILISDHVLSSSELTAASQSGSIVFSLVNDPAETGFAAWPAFVDENAVLNDFSAFADSTWKPGDNLVGQAQSITVNSQVLMQSVTDGIKNEETVLTNNPSLVQTAFTSMPVPLKLAYSPIVNLGS